MLVFLINDLIIVAGVCVCVCVCADHKETSRCRCRYCSLGWLEHCSTSQHVYVRDVLGRLDDVKAKLTYVYGTVLKMDSTKKVTHLTEDMTVQLTAACQATAYCCNRHRC